MRGLCKVSFLIFGVVCALGFGEQSHTPDKTLPLSLPLEYYYRGKTPLEAAETNAPASAADVALDYLIAPAAGSYTTSAAWSGNGRERRHYQPRPTGRRSDRPCRVRDELSKDLEQLGRMLKSKC